MDKRSLLGVIGAVTALHVAGGGLVVVSAPAESGRLAVGAALTAYLLGARHAFDADHIAAIDNTSRALRARRLPTATVGLWFALGHSAVVLASCLLLGIGWRSAETPPVAGAWGPLAAGTFLVGIGVVNALVLRELIAHRRDEDETSRLLTGRGMVSRLLGQRAHLLHRPRHMMLVGLLFGLGLDTATSVGILILTAGAEHSAMSPLVFLALPLLFAAGMTLFDCLDSALMTAVYGWAGTTPRRRVGYNIVVTALSVTAALTIGMVTLGGLATEHGADALTALGSVDLDNAGFALVATFAAIWVVAASAASTRQRR